MQDDDKSKKEELKAKLLRHFNTNAFLSTEELSKYKHGDGGGENGKSAFHVAASLKTDLEGNSATIRQRPLSTGFEAIDKILQGGLRQGLYLIAGGTSVGKTALTMQIADNIASQASYYYSASQNKMRPKKDVLIFSLEMSKQELISRSISRLTFEAAASEYGFNDYKLIQEHAARQLVIEEGLLYDKESSKHQVIQDCFISYLKNISQNLFIVEPEGMLTPEAIERAIQEHIQFAKTEYLKEMHRRIDEGKTVEILDGDPLTSDDIYATAGNDDTLFAPIVIIDYLQLMASDDTTRHKTSKETMDECILRCKQLSRKYKTTIIGISSVSRGQYEEQASLSMFKETGAMEYSADVAIGLEFTYCSHTNYDASMERALKPRELTLRVLKNRKGEIRHKNLYFYSEFSCFLERSAPVEPLELACFYVKDKEGFFRRRLNVQEKETKAKAKKSK